ncbi:MAG: hypothetical protein R6V06_01790 [Kiritimatiellia bacterium]
MPFTTDKNICGEKIENDASAVFLRLSDGNLINRIMLDGTRLEVSGE